LSCTVQVANRRKTIGLLYAGVHTAANAGLPEDRAGLAAAVSRWAVRLDGAHARVPSICVLREGKNPGAAAANHR